VWFPSGAGRYGLDACYRDHQDRVESLKAFIEAHGVTPSEVPSRKSFGRIPGVTAAIPDRGVVDILEEGVRAEPVERVPADAPSAEDGVPVPPVRRRRPHT
jgi:hypothetical protein